MKLYYSPTSPYVRKVMVLLRETGQLDDVTLDSITPTPTDPPKRLLGTNPLTKIPALELTSGESLFDSRVICAYLDDRAGSGLYSQGTARWRTMTLEALADGILDAALLMTYENRLRPQDKYWDDWVQGQWHKIAGACGVLNTQWQDHLNGPLDMGQIALGCALGYVDFRHGARDWRAGNPALADWYLRFDSRPSMQETAPPAA